MAKTRRTTVVPERHSCRDAASVVSRSPTAEEPDRRGEMQAVDAQDPFTLRPGADWRGLPNPIDRADAPAARKAAALARVEARIAVAVKNAPPLSRELERRLRELVVLAQEHEREKGSHA
jgi:hypothetical protein